MISGAIDVGGTKIEARLFDEAMETIDTRRIATPVADFPSFMAGLADQTRWLLGRSGDAALPVGIGMPGFIDPVSGASFTSNLPATGHDVRAALAGAMGRDFVFGNDCMAFAYSEAHGGAAAGARTVVGLILGTGLGSGVCIDGRLPARRNGLAVEIGHVGLSAHALAAFGLPAWPCGCGKTGCLERYVSGSGMAAIAEFVLGTRITAADIARRAGEGDAGAERVLTIWAELAAECLAALQLAFDPDCIVLGGGLSRMEGLLERLAGPLESHRLGPVPAPNLLIARHGDSSGARGMALLALHAPLA